MFEIKVRGLGAAQDLRHTWSTKTVSLLDPSMVKGWPVNSNFHHTEFFDDVDLPHPGYLAPTKEQMERVLEFTKSFVEDDKVLIHCHAGISRSTATAIAVCVQHGMSPREAIEHIESIRNQLWPNGLVIQLADEILGLDGALLSELGAWKLEKQNKIEIRRQQIDQEAAEQMQKWLKLVS